MLKNFVSNSVCLYGESFVGHNVHGLIHLAEDVKRYGSLYNFSAFPFESYLNVLKKTIRKSHKPLEQLVKRLAEIENQVKGQCKNADRNKTYIFKREHQYGPVPPNCHGIQFEKVWMGQRFLSCKTKADSCVMMTNKTIVIIRNFVSIEGEPYIVGCSFLDACDLFTVSIESSRLDIYKMSILSEELQLWPLKSVWKKMLFVV